MNSLRPNKGFGRNFPEGCLLRKLIPEDRMVELPKRYEYEDENDSLSDVNDMPHLRIFDSFIF